MSEAITRNDLGAIIKGLRLHEYATETKSYSNTSIKSGTFDVWKIGRVVYFCSNGALNNLASDGAYHTYITLDPQFRPISNMYIEMSGRDTETMKPVLMRVETNGTVSFLNYGSSITSAQNGMISGSWLTSTSTNYITNFQNNELSTVAHPYGGRGQTGTAGIVTGNTTIDGNTLPITQTHLAGNTLDADLFYRATRTDTDVSVGFGIESGGINHGIWSGPLNKWMIYSDGTDIRVDGVHMPKVTKVFEGTAANTTTNWECTGLSFTIPAGHTYILYVLQNYNAGAPQGIGLDTTSSLASWKNCPGWACYYPGSGIQYSNAWLMGQGTYYIYTKRGSSSGSYKNTYTVWAVDFH